MKTLQHLCLAVVFTLTLTTATFAGEIGTGGKTTPPPDSATATTSGGTLLEPKDDAEYEYQLMGEITLQLLRTMVSVF